MNNSLWLKEPLSDLYNGFLRWQIWIKLAWFEIRNQYSRSVIGPFWITISTTVMVLVFGILYGDLMGRKPSQHLPYVASGLVIWLLYSEILISSCKTLISNGRLIQQIKLPYSIYIYKAVSQIFIGFLHNAVIILVIFIVFPNSFGVNLLACVLGLVLIVINSITLSFIFSIVSLRFRDFPPIVAAFMRPMMFLTPIIWDADMFAERAAFVLYNPFYHIIEVVRAPLLGESPLFMSWMAVLGMTVIFALCAIALFTKYYKRIAYWV